MDANTASSKYTPTTWGAAGSTLYDFTCPSGQVVQLKKVSLPEILGAGLLDEMDVLGPLMDMNAIAPAQGRKQPSDRPAKKLTKAQEAAKAEEEEANFVKILIQDPSKFQSMTRMIERLVPVFVVKPTIYSPWRMNDKNALEKIPDSERTDGYIYADSVPFNDQMALFGEAMKDTSASDIAAFRDSSEPGVGSVEDGGGVPLPTE